MRLLKLTPQQAAPPGLAQAAFFEAPPGLLHDGSSPEVKVAFFGALIRRADGRVHSAVLQSAHPGPRLPVPSRRHPRIAAQEHPV
jgi:hypothetical protein